VPSPRRPADTYDPAARIPLSLRVRAPIKAAMEKAIEISGRSLMAEAEYRLEWYDEHERRSGGPRTLQLSQILCSISLLLFPDENDWLDNAENYAVVRDAWVEAIDNRAPPEPVPPELEITLVEQAEAGRRLIAELATTSNPRRQAHLRSLLWSLAKLAAFDDATRAEFAVAASTPFEPVPWADRPPTPPVPADWTASPLDHLSSAWQIARAVSLGRQTQGEPDELAIAAHLLGDVNLRQHGGIPDRVQTAEELLEYRAELSARASVADIEAVEPETIEPQDAANEAAKSDAPEAVDLVEHRLWRTFSMLARLDPDKFPQRTAAIFSLLRLLSKDPSLPSEVRAEFAAIASGETK
jgi:hypothetical protein